MVRPLRDAKSVARFSVGVRGLALSKAMPQALRCAIGLITNYVSDAKSESASVITNYELFGIHTVKIEPILIVDSTSIRPR
jgi:hypothetical protein